jgi:hypothetical protein
MRYFLPRLPLLVLYELVTSHRLRFYQVQYDHILFNEILNSHIDPCEFYLV